MAWQEWRIEILIALLVCLAVFLLVERMNISQSVYRWLVDMLGQFARLLDSASEGLAKLVRATTVSDLIGYLLLFVVAGLVLWRTRHRLLTMPRFSDAQCPRCGGQLTRIHRRRIDRLLNWFVPLRRFRCKNEECAWRGLRVYHSNRRMSEGRQE